MLKVRNLVAGYGRTPVARLAELDLAPREAALVLGPSGAGKTTLLLALAGLARTFSGEALVDGVAPAALSPAARDRFRGRNIGFVFQDIHLIAGLSTLDNLLLAPFAAGVAQDRPRAAALLEELGLTAQGGQRAETLSRGQAQRAAIARAMLMRPKLILADEPTASLDDDSCAMVGALLLKAAAETDAALVIATHDQRLKALIPRTVQAEAAA
jgi:ABC-type lipoprotein export system ATPase subunit